MTLLSVKKANSSYINCLGTPQLMMISAKFKQSERSFNYSLNLDKYPRNVNRISIFLKVSIQMYEMKVKALTN